MEDPENPALRADGTLKDASKIKWLNSPSDEQNNPFEIDPSGSPSQSSNTPVNDPASPTPPGHWQSNKSPASKVAGKRRIQVSSRFRDGSREPSIVKAIAGEYTSRTLLELL